ncbi:MAG TPA: hypothetical protein VFT74_19960, partial [Isosphaeraceae bacterium]|nr:hypothetical protein [Isosphaeraceae bacterium]
MIDGKDVPYDTMLQAEVPPQELYPVLHRTFLMMPEVRSITGKIKQIQERLSDAERKACNPETDPTCRRITAQLADAQEKYERLWKDMYPKLIRLLLTSLAGRQLLSRDENHSPVTAPSPLSDVPLGQTPRAPELEAREN